MNKTLLAASLLALASLTSVAAAADDSWYVRGTLGSGRISVDGLGHDDATGGSIGLGYWFNRNFAIEGAYTDFGDHNGAKIDSWGLGLVGKAHFNQADTGWFVDGRIGIARLEARFHGIGGSDDKAYVGAGLGYDFNKNFGASINYLWNDGGSGASASLASVGLEARF